MNNSLLNRTLTTAFLSISLFSFSIHAENQVIEKVHKQITTELTKCQEPDLCDSFQKHAHAIELLFVCFLNKNNDELLRIRIEKMRAVINLFEQHVLTNIDQKIPGTTDPQKKQALTTVRTLLHDVLTDLRAICCIFDDYKGEVDLISLVSLGNKLSKYKHRLPKNMRGWTTGEWKKIIQHLAQYVD